MIIRALWKMTVVTFFKYLLVVTLLKFKTSAIPYKAKCLGKRCGLWVSVIKTHNSDNYEDVHLIISQKLELRTVACPFSFVIKKEFDIHVHTSTFIEINQPY